jgi:hypothetical protein
MKTKTTITKPEKRLYHPKIINKKTLRKDFISK